MDDNTTVSSLRELVRQFCSDRDWDQFHGPKDLAIGIATEASELLEKFRFLSDHECRQKLDQASTREEIEDELADVQFFVLRFADRFDVDLDAAVRRKLAKNAKRYPVDKARGSNRKYSDL